MKMQKPDFDAMGIIEGEGEDILGGPSTSLQSLPSNGSEAQRHLECSPCPGWVVATRRPQSCLSQGQFGAEHVVFGLVLAGELHRGAGPAPFGNSVSWKLKKTERGTGLGCPSAKSARKEVQILFAQNELGVSKARDFKTAHQTTEKQVVTGANHGARDGRRASERQNGSFGDFAAG
jgi:hypothetical protein